MDVVGAADVEGEGEGECEVGDGDGVEVEGNDRAGVGHDSLHLDSVDQGLGEGSVLERGVIETPDIVPDCRMSAIRS